MEFLNGFFWGLGIMVCLIVAAIAFIGFITYGLLIIQDYIYKKRRK